MSEYEQVVEQARLLLRMGRVTEALQCCDHARRMQPARGEAWYMRGVILDAAGHVDPALGALRKAIELDPTLREAWYMQAYMLGRDAEDEGIAAYREMLLRFPEDFHAWHNLGCLHRIAGELEQALTCFAEAEKRDDRSPALFFNRGRVHEELGNVEAARQAYARSVALFADFEPGREALRRLGAADPT